MRELTRTSYPYFRPLHHPYRLFPIDENGPFDTAQQRRRHSNEPHLSKKGHQHRMSMSGLGLDGHETDRKNKKGESIPSETSTLGSVVNSPDSQAT